MNFLSMKTRVAEETGLDLTNDDTKLGIWINEVYRFVSGLRNWPWLLKNGVIQTVEDITTSTATVTSGGTTVILSAIGTTESIQDNYMIQFTDDSDNWYLITSHTAGQSTFTISPGYLGTSDLTDGTCLLRKVSYSLASDVDRLIDFREMVNDTSLPIWDIRDYDKGVPDPDVTGSPQNIVLAGLDTSTSETYNYWKVIVDPIPDSKLNIHYRYYQSVSDMISNTGHPLLPETWHQVIPLMALATYGHLYIDDNRINGAMIRAKTMLNEMVKSVNVTPGKLDVVQAWDQRRGRTPGKIRFPSNFDERWSM